MPLQQSDSFELPDTAKYLPDTEDDDSDQPDIEGDGEPGETFNKKPLPPEEIVTVAKKEITEKKLDGKEPTTTDRREQGGGGGRKGHRAGGISSTGLKSRFIYNHSDASYALILRADKDFKGKISLSSVGEDNEAEPVYFKKVFENSSEISLSDGNEKLPISIAANEVKKLKVSISRNEILSLRCTAYEN
jgi:hypothetical protein